MGLHQYAARFAESGLASFVFDYRTFGGSDGEPRNWISPSRHLQVRRARTGLHWNGLDWRDGRLRCVMCVACRYSRQNGSIRSQSQ